MSPDKPDSAPVAPNPAAPTDRFCRVPLSGSEALSPNPTTEPTSVRSTDPISYQDLSGLSGQIANIPTSAENHPCNGTKPLSDSSGPRDCHNPTIPTTNPTTNPTATATTPQEEV
jgi:hypothetical protein